MFSFSIKLTKKGIARGFDMQGHLTGLVGMLTANMLASCEHTNIRKRPAAFFS